MVNTTVIIFVVIAGFLLIILLINVSLTFYQKVTSRPPITFNIGENVKQLAESQKESFVDLQYTPVSQDLLPIFYTYILASTNCKEVHIPLYVWLGIKQVVDFQTNKQVYLVTDIPHCPDTIKNAAPFKDRLIILDSANISSRKTRKFQSQQNNILPKDDRHLHATSTLRFFLIEDAMRIYKYNYAFHLEGDNLLYGSFHEMLTHFEYGYPKLAVIPVSRDSHDVTASVLWIGKSNSLCGLTDFLLDLTYSNNNLFEEYFKWATLFKSNKCRKDKICLTKYGLGMKESGMNDMSFLAYYHQINPNEINYFPVLPSLYMNSVERKSGVTSSNISAHSTGGSYVGPNILGGIFDPNSYGQFFSHKNEMTDKVKGRSHKDRGHIVAAAMDVCGCQIEMRCSATAFIVDQKEPAVCLTGPYVKCRKLCRDSNDPMTHTWTPLWNLHVDPRNMSHYLSKPCNCGA